VVTIAVLLGALIVGRGRFFPAQPNTHTLPSSARTSSSDAAAAPASSGNSPRAASQGGLAAGSGPSDLGRTLERIAVGIHQYREDGSVFGNREGLLPAKPYGYYLEYVHPTPRVRGPGAQRVVIGKNGEVYYSPDHYRTFVRVEQTAYTAP
jgi:guanyl-specific ribonuclease Sa